MEVWCKDRAKSRRDLEEYLGECANLGTGCTDLVRTLYGPYGSVRTETSRKFTSGAALEWLSLPGSLEGAWVDER